MARSTLTVAAFRKTQHCSSCGTELEPFEHRHGVCTTCFAKGEQVQVSVDYQDQEVTLDLVEQLQDRGL